MGGKASKVTDQLKGAVQQKTINVSMTPSTYAAKFAPQSGGKKKKLLRKELRKGPEKNPLRKGLRKEEQIIEVNLKKMGDLPDPDCECTGWKKGTYIHYLIHVDRNKII